MSKHYSCHHCDGAGSHGYPGGPAQITCQECDGSGVRYGKVVSESTAENKNDIPTTASGHTTSSHVMTQPEGHCDQCGINCTDCERDALRERVAELEGALEAMRPVVQTAEAWRDSAFGRSSDYHELRDAVDAYRRANNVE